MKKLISIIFALLLALALPVAVFADEKAEEKLTLPDYTKHLPYYYTLMTKAEKEDYLTIRKAVINHDKVLRVKAADMSQEFIEKAQLILYKYDSYTFDLENVGGSSSGFKRNGVYRPTDFELKFNYKMSKENYMRAISYTDKKVQKFLEGIPEDMSTTNKLLAAHDFIIESCEYDLEYEHGYSAYSAIVYGRALCEGYAKAFQYICEEMGIPCVISIGESNESKIGHAWNKVKVGKNWYNIDVTNDDTDGDFFGYISKNYFFLADSEYKTVVTETFFDELEEPLATDTEHAYYEMTNQTFKTSEEAIKYMETKLQKDLPVHVVVAFTTKAEYNKFGKAYFDAATKTPAMKKYRDVSAYKIDLDESLTYMLYFFAS
ncbi:MAG: hypothetical protein LBL98_01585 [Ruminococcus sp.]|nr:hypothetical protein [Ruminococcus sp.]